MTVIRGNETYAPQETPAMRPSKPGPKAELRCLDCGYGAVTSSDDIRCPLCGGDTWDFAEWRPFSS